MADWTRDRVEERLIEAADVRKRLPEVRVQGYFSVWPKIVHEFVDLAGQEPPRMKRPQPLPDAIADTKYLALLAEGTEPLSD